jgi:pyruvate/2-oxoglutarate dehydrogenase complex dihydrolipoamide acyltransferase (E2) component
MSTEVLLPKLGFAMEEAELSEWLVEDGDQAVEGQPLYAIEADKSTNEVESPASGTLRIMKQTGETYAVGTVLAIIE